MISNGALHRCGPDGSDIDIPSIDGMAVRHVDQQSLFIGATIDHLHLGEPDALFVSRCCRDARHHHQLDHLLAFLGQLPALRLFQAIFGGGNVLVCEGFEELCRGQLP